MDDRSEQQRTYFARKELGLCVICGMEAVKEGKHVLCAECAEKYRDSMEEDEHREWRKRYQHDYREDINVMCKRIAAAAQKFIEAGELKTPDRAAPAGHKCWHCFWATWCGDRFFCPLAFTCIKEKLKTEVLNDGR